MKIGLSTSVIQRGKTGIAQYVFSLLRAFQKSDVEARFCLFTLEEDAPFFAELDHRFEVIPVKEKFRPAVKNILWHQTILPGLTRELGLDVMHIPSYRRLLWASACPRVATIHDLAPFRVSKKYDLARMFYGRVMVKRLARRQDRIIAVSENTACDIETFFGIPRQAVRVIHNGIDHEHFHPRGAEAVRLVREKINLAKPFFLYVARLEHPGKNHVRLIEAFEHFKQRTGSDWSLVFGGSDWHGAAAIHQRAAQSPHRGDIRALGFIGDAELPSLYSAAAAFVYPSLYEGFGLPPLEAMACGCPVICSARGSLGEVVGDAAVIIDPENTNELVSALSRIASEPLLRQALVSHGHARAQHFSWQRAAEQTFAVYRQAANPAFANKTNPIPSLATK